MLKRNILGNASKVDENVMLLFIFKHACTVNQAVYCRINILC